MQIIRKFPDWLIYLIILILWLGPLIMKDKQADTPPAPPETGPVLPDIKPYDPKVLVRIDKPKSGIGTAFSIDNKGNWLTARHVVDKCSRIGLGLSGNSYVRVEKAIISNKSDTAILTTKWKRKPFARDFFTRRQIGETGYFIGYPQGKPGELAGRLMGRRQMIVSGRYRSKEPVLAWSEIGRTRGLVGSIGGLSGGPAFDRDGEVIGLVTAESPRRGRIYTVAPKSLAEIAPKLNSKTNPRPISVKNYGLRADSLRRSRRIAKVLCLVE